MADLRACLGSGRRALSVSAPEAGPQARRPVNLQT